MNCARLATTTTTTTTRSGGPFGVARVRH
jgi:hypothetical protein